MTQHHLSRFIPRTTLVVALLALSLLAGAGLGATRPAAASSCTGPIVAFCDGYPIDVTFESITFSSTSDGDFTSPLEVYASFLAEVVGGAGSVRNLGAWGAYGCNAAKFWSTSESAECPKAVSAGGTYSFADTLLCAASSYTHCTGSWKKNNNTIRLLVKPGQSVRVAIHMMDYDWNSGDDEACKTWQVLGPFTGAELLSLNQQFPMAKSWDGNACKVFVRIKRVGL